MAVEEINAKGGVNGVKLVLDIQDSGGKPETATAIAAGEPRVEAVVHRTNRGHIAILVHDAQS